MPSPSTGSWWPFPPETREVQLDEKWGFVYQKEKSCDPTDPLDRFRGDDWDHTAVDPESRLLLCLVPGKREGAACERVLREVHDRTAGRTDLLFTATSMPRMRRRSRRSMGSSGHGRSARGRAGRPSP